MNSTSRGYEGSSAGVFKSLLAAACGLLFLAVSVDAQTLNFANHRDITVPDYATLRIGPFYSTMTFSQSIGCRYTTSSGNGTEFLFDNNRGQFKKDGSDIPMVSSLSFRNYLLISQSMDMDMSVTMTYYHYPMGTQADDFEVNLADQGINGNFSTEFELTPVVKGTGYDRLIYRADYIDTRGRSDLYGGSQYKHLDNTVGVNLDWLMMDDRDMTLKASREDNIPMEGDNFKDQRLVSYNETIGYQQKFWDFVTAGLDAAYTEDSYPSATNNRPDSFEQTYTAYSTVRLTGATVGKASLGYSLGSVSGNTELGLGDQIAPGSYGTVVGGISFQTQLSKSLSQSLSFARSQQAGFNTSFERDDSFAYNLTWKGELTQASLFSTLSTVDPLSTNVNKYSDWSSGVSVAYPVYLGLPLIYGEDNGQYVTLHLSSSYDMRDNGVLSPTVSQEPEWQNNYSTWISTIGASAPFIAADLTLSADVQHIARISDNTQLAYTREIFEVTVTYTHQF